MSTPSESPNARSSTSFGVIADAGSGTPGALIPLCSPISPPSITVVSIVAPSVPSTRSSTRPSASSSRSPGRTLRASPANVVDSRPGSPGRSPVTMRSASPAFNCERPSAFERAGADLRTAEILEDRHLAAGARGRRPHALERGAPATRACRARNSGGRCRCRPQSARRAFHRARTPGRRWR